MNRLLIAGAVTLLAANAAAAVFASGVPGLRRDTGCIAAFYLLFVAVWRFVSAPRARLETSRLIAAVALAALVVHHVVVFRVNYSAVSDPTRAESVAWFVTDVTPSTSLDRWSRAVAAGAVLDCRTLAVQTRCRYPEIYAAVAGASEWNDRRSVPVFASDSAGGVTTLTRDSFAPGALQR